MHDSEVDCLLFRTGSNVVQVFSLTAAAFGADVAAIVNRDAASLKSRRTHSFLLQTLREQMIDLVSAGSSGIKAPMSAQLPEQMMRDAQPPSFKRICDVPMAYVSLVYVSRCSQVRAEEPFLVTATRDAQRQSGERRYFASPYR